MNNFEIYTYLKAKNEGGGHKPTVINPALRLVDWEGTVLKEYTAEQVENLTVFPIPSSLNNTVDRDLLTFQNYNRSLNDVKSWITAHKNQCLTIGVIYTTIDGQDHNYWNNPRLNTTETISKQKKATISVETDAFKSCSSLKNINIPEGVTSIGNSAFTSCSSLTNINIPEGVTSIGNSAFYMCSSLTNVNIPKGVTSIGSSAFYMCSSLTNINIPEGVTSIGNSAFNSCYSLTSVNIPEGVTSIGSSAFSSCRSLTNINIPEDVTNIRDSAFSSCNALTNINIPEGVTSIGNSAFSSCNALTNINIPEGVTSIGDNAFNSCYSLTSVNIPKGVTSIGSSAFSSCRSLVDVVVQGKPSLSNVDVFNNTYEDLRIYVPRVYLTWYSTATNWNVFYDDNVIVAIEDYIEYLNSIGIDVSGFEEE